MPSYLYLSDELVVVGVLRVWEFIDFDFMLLYLFHYLMKGERKRVVNADLRTDQKTAKRFNKLSSFQGAQEEVTSLA